jgi:hypothetical protein
MGNVCEGLMLLTGLNKRILKKAHFMHDKLIMLAVYALAKKMSGKVENFKIARGTTGSSMRYCCFIINREID